MTKTTTAKAKSQRAEKRDDKEQSRRFIAAAIERDAARLSSPADKLLGKLAKTPPEPRKKRD